MFTSQNLITKSVMNLLFIKVLEVKCEQRSRPDSCVVFLSYVVFSFARFIPRRQSGVLLKRFHIQIPRRVFAIRWMNRKKTYWIVSIVNSIGSDSEWMKEFSVFDSNGLDDKRRNHWIYRTQCIQHQPNSRALLHRHWMMTIVWMSIRCVLCVRG